MDILTELIEADDTKGLLRLVDGMCDTREWDELVRVAEACRKAAERGRQLWPVSMHVEYRLALEAPAEYAAAVVESDASRFTPGPLTEVAASAHTWEELAPHAPSRNVAAILAQERVLRGEDLTGDDRTAREIFELPMCLDTAEFGYPPPVYKHDSAEFDDPGEPESAGGASFNVDSGGAWRDVGVAEPGPLRLRAWRDLLETWTAQSNATVQVREVSGFGEEGRSEEAVSGAIAAHGLDARACEISAGEALGRMTWAAASGAAHGRRRGGAAGRFGAWWCAATLLDLDWPPHEGFLDELGAAGWFWWEPVPRPAGWVFALAVSDPASGWAGAVLAIDEVDDGTRPATGE